MTDPKKNSAIISNGKAPAAASEYLFDFAPLPKPHSADAEPSPDSSKAKRRVSRRSESHTAQASDAASPVAVVVSTSISELDEVPAGAAAPLASHAAVHRVSIISTEKQRISGLQHFTTAADTLCEAAKAILTVLKDNAYRHVEVTAAGVQVDHLLSSVGRSELSRQSGLNRTTVRLAIRQLVERHLIALHAPSEGYKYTREIYQLFDPCAAAERMRVEDGIVGWRQRGPGRVVY